MYFFKIDLKNCQITHLCQILRIFLEFNLNIVYEEPCLNAALYNFRTICAYWGKSEENVLSCFGLVGEKMYVSFLQRTSFNIAIH